MTYPWFVVHDGAVVVAHQVVRADPAVLRAILRADVLPDYLNPFISVASRVLVPHSEGMPDLMYWDTKLQDKPTNHICRNVQK